MRRAPTITATTYRRLASEDNMIGAIAELVGHLGGVMWHVNDSRLAPETEHMPDLIIIVPGLIALIELKSQKRRVTLGQQYVRELMQTIPASAAHVIAWHVRPDPNRAVGERSFDELLERLRVSRTTGDRA